jgi:polysaccharide biosynthesis protein PslH
LASVLFITPAVPAADRNGLAMRAGVSVEALHQRHQLTVAVVRSPFDETPFEWVRGHARTVVETLCVDDRSSSFSWLASERGRRVAGHPLPAMARLRPPSIGELILDRVGCEFDVVVVMGSYAVGVAIPFLDRGVTGILDAFDDDARACESLALLDSSLADEVPQHEAFQREVFPWFDRVLFASTEDAMPPFVHLPNAVRIPVHPHRTRSTSSSGEPLGLLFVGNAGYLPNRDALSRLRRRIVPAIEEHGVAVRLLHPGADDDVDEFYQRAHIAAVPLRAGGGTRIKILEAFAHRCPVVSTPTGARGLDVTPGEHLVLTAEDEDDAAFAQAVVDLARDAPRRQRLAASAWAWVAEHHDHREVGARLATIVDECAARA